MHAKSVLKFARTIYIPYCFDLTHEPKSYYKTAFFHYTYRTFAPSKAQCERMKKCGCPRTVFEGYPTLDRPAPDPDRTSEDRIKTVLWTPRWTEADFYGGTSFYDCRESFLAFQKTHPELRCVFRPHPLLYENAVKEGKMTGEEMADLLNRYRNAGIIIDPNADVNNTLAGTDVLLTDFSSIIMNAFLYGIPIVYLKDLPRTPLYEPFESISGTLYYPKNWEEAKTQAARLLENEDPMKEKREALLLGVLEENKDSAKKITEAIAADYFGK